MVLTRVLPDLDNMIKNFVVGSVITVCKNSIKCDSHIKIEGTLGVTIDDGEIIFIHLSEIISQQILSGQGPAFCTHIKNSRPSDLSQIKSANTVGAETISNEVDQQGLQSPTKDANDQEGEMPHMGSGETTENDSPVVEKTCDVTTNENPENSQEYEQILRTIKEERGNEMSDAVGFCFITPVNQESMNDNFEDNYDEYQDIKTNTICPDAYLVHNDLGFYSNELPEDMTRSTTSQGETSEMEFDDNQGLFPSENRSENEIINILMDHPQGRIVLQEFKETGKIGKSRSILVQVLVANLTRYNFYPSTREKICLAKNIIETFPCLRGDGPLGFEDFYTPYSSKVSESGKKKAIPAHGSIEDRLKNVRKTLKIGLQNSEA